jgi:hypothetical protein
MQRTSYGFALAGRHYVSALQGQRHFDNCGARPIRLQCVPLSVSGNERHNLSRQPFAALPSIQSSNDFMGKWVHGSVHEEVSAADLERFGSSKLHDAPVRCNGGETLGGGTFESVPLPKRLMDSSKIVIHEIEHQRVLVVFKRAVNLL